MRTFIQDSCDSMFASRARVCALGSQPTVSLIVVALCIAGCANHSEDAGSRLPFRLALIPFEREDLDPRPEETLATGSPTLNLRLKSDLASGALVIAFSDTFADVVILEPPSGVDPERLAEWPEEKRDRHWISEAQRLRANLIMECDLKTSNRVESQLNEKFWLNLPLFIIGGPASYFVDDRSYSFRARLRTRIHLFDAILDGHATLADGRAELSRSEVNFSGTSLDFIDRVGSAPLSYLFSAVVPVGFLAVANDRVRSRLQHALAAHLASAANHSVQEASTSILQADQVVEFYLDPELEILSTPSGIQVRGEAVLRHGRTRRLDSFTVSDGLSSVSGRFGPGTVDREQSSQRERYHRYPFSALLPSRSADTLEVELVAGGREKRRRTFTVRGPFPEGGDHYEEDHVVRSRNHSPPKGRLLYP